MPWGRGFGWGVRAGILPPCLEYLSKEQQLEVLKAEQEMLKRSLEEIEKKIKELSEKK
jgi:hypothetical protein